jgi:hypothetical protein
VLLQCTLWLREFDECYCNSRYGYEGLVSVIVMHAMVTRVW